MTYKNSQMAREARILKAVGTVVALFALSLAGLTIALAPSEARPEALLVATGTFGIAIFMWTYASRPHLFTNDPEGVLGDELRTRYVVPERPALDPAPTDRTRAVPVTEHIYAWQEVRRVPAGERVWTLAYGRLVVGQSIAAVLAVLAVGALIDGVTLGLGLSAGPVWFVAAGIILAVGFAMSHRSGLVDANAYTQGTQAALPDLTWTPVLAPAPVADVKVEPLLEAHAA